MRVLGEATPEAAPRGGLAGAGVSRFSGATPERSSSHHSTDSRLSPLAPGSGGSQAPAEQPATSGVGALAKQALSRRYRSASPSVSSTTPQEEQRSSPSFWSGAALRIRGVSVDEGRELHQQQQPTPSKRLFGGTAPKSPEQQPPAQLLHQPVASLTIPVATWSAGSAVTSADVTGIPGSPTWGAATMPAGIGREFAPSTPTSAALKAERHVRAARIQHFWRKKSRSGQGSKLASSHTTPSSTSSTSRPPTLTLPLGKASVEDARTLVGSRSPFAGAMSKAAVKIQSSWRRQRSRGSGKGQLEDGEPQRIASWREKSVLLPRLAKTPTPIPKESDNSTPQPADEKLGGKGFWGDTQSWFERQARQTWKGMTNTAGQGLLETWWKDRKKRAMESLLHNSTPVLKKTLGDLGDLLKENATADPDMWTWVRPITRTVISSFWEDIELEIETGLKIAVLKKPEPETKKERRAHDPSLARGLRWLGLKIRAFVLSHYLPHNKSVFGRLKDPIYLLMTASTMLPIFGIRVFFFSAILMMLLFPGPPDEFQLINFILIFKGTQFFTTGVILGYFGAISYYVCYLFAGDNLRECIDTQGPGAKDWLSSLLFDYVGSMCLVWVAFLALPLSRRHCNSHYALGSSTPVQKAPEVYCFCLKGIQGRGGRLRRLLRYDLAMFLFSTIVFLPVYFAAEEELEPSHRKFTRAKQTIFWCRILYSIFSLPFVIFVIPGLGRVLTHSVTTGYDSSGACLEFAFPSRFVESKPKVDNKSKVENCKAG